MKPRMPYRATLLIMGASALLMTGCVVHEHGYVEGPAVSAGITVNEEPPPPIVETVTVAPGPDYVWVGGAYAWHGRWMWERGHWMRPPHRGAVWVPHRYEYRHGHRVWVQGGWR